MKKIRKINLELKKDVISKLNDTELFFAKGGRNITGGSIPCPTVTCVDQTITCNTNKCWATMQFCENTTNCILPPVNPVSNTCPPMNTQHVGCSPTIKTLDGCITKDCQPIG